MRPLLQEPEIRAFETTYGIGRPSRSRSLFTQGDDPATGCRCR
ncbi:hypothetical protein ACFWN1_13575 [Streptomyces sp. NPDC058459]